MTEALRARASELRVARALQNLYRQRKHPGRSGNRTHMWRPCGVPAAQLRTCVRCRGAKRHQPEPLPSPGLADTPHALVEGRAVIRRLADRACSWRRPVRTTTSPLPSVIRSERRFSMKRGRGSRGRDLLGPGGGSWFSSLYGLLGGGRIRSGRRTRPWSISVRGRQATRTGRGTCGANGSPLVSMCQIASARVRASSTRATLAPRWRPRRVLVRW